MHPVCTGSTSASPRQTAGSYFKMEKYYLANLSAGREQLFKAATNRKIKLVDVQYARRGPSLGVVRLDDLEPEKRADRARQQISLAILELADNKTAKFGAEKQVELSGVASRIVDFDSRETIFVDGAAASGNAQHPHCVLLAENGDLFAVNLIDKQCMPLLTSGCEDERSQPAMKRPLRNAGFAECKLQITTDDCFVHSLADRYYVLHRLSHKLEPLHEYSLDQAQPHLTGMFPIESRPHPTVILKLSDSSLRVVQRSVCVANIEPPESAPITGSHLLLSTNQSQNECLLISLWQTRVVARRLQLTSEPQNDPDQLLPKEPSFEIEECWSLELADIDSNRSLDQEPGFAPSLAVRSCPMWSTSQLNPESCWPKYLIIIYEFHLLVYTFEQPLINPFSVVYDSSFLGLTPDGEAAGSHSIKLLRNVKANQEQQENIDVKQRPRLVHNFKLIGPHPNDSLFNTFFLVLGARIVTIGQFAQLGLLVAVSQLGHVLAFKFTSPSLNFQKDTIYQQLVLESLRDGMLLREEANRLEVANRQLKASLSTLERRQQVGMDQFAGENALDTLLLCRLTPCEDQLASIYDLSLSLPNLMQLSRIVIVSTVNSYILEPTSQAIDVCHINNNVVRPVREVLGNRIDLLTNIEQSSDDRVTALIEQMSDRQHDDSEQVQSYALLEISADFNRLALSNSDISLRLIILDSQSGFIRVFYLFNEPSESRAEQDLKLTMWRSLIGSDQDVTAFHMKSIRIKPLLSYRSQPGEVDSANPSVGRTRITGLFERSTIANWLDECFQSEDDNSFMRIDRGKFHSQFTHCDIGYNIDSEGGQLELLSEDLVGLELVKKHLLKRATDSLIKLDVNDTVPAPQQLRRLIGLQRKNLSALLERILSLNKDTESGQNIGDQVELMMDTLTSEVAALDEDTPDWLMKSLRDDVETLLLRESGNTNLRTLRSQ